MENEHTELNKMRDRIVNHKMKEEYTLYMKSVKFKYWNQLVYLCVSINISIIIKYKNLDIYDIEFIDNG